MKMLNCRGLLTIVLVVLIQYLFAQHSHDFKLWYNVPADATIADKPYHHTDDAEWLKALPLGNGWLGAMVFGDVHQDRIQLNEKTLWSGSQFDNDNPEAAAYLPMIRNMLFNGKYKEATELTNKTQICRGQGSGFGNGANVPFGCFQTLGDLWIQFDKKSPYTAYYRELDLSKAVIKMKYVQDGTLYNREYFISRNGNVLAIKLSSSKKNALNFTLKLTRPEKYHTFSKDGQLCMSGILSNGQNGAGMQYLTRLQVKSKGGRQMLSDTSIRVTHAHEVFIYLSAATDYTRNYPFYSGNDFEKITQSNISKAYQKDYTILLKAHLKAYKSIFDRVSFTLLSSSQHQNLPVDELLKKVKATQNDNDLTSLYFAYGRYLLISSTAENSLPANLQGIWNNKIQPAWNCDYHTNINLQMNYWPAEVTNLGELHKSLIDFIIDNEKPATISAKVQFGAEGWCVNPIMNIWGYTSPGEYPGWGLTPGASGWICQHLWEHYAYNQDTVYLRKIYPTLKNAARFYTSWLVPDPTSGRWVSGPAASPENGFVAPDGSHGSISMGPSHDQQIIEELFTNVIKSAAILNDHSQEIKKLSHMIHQLSKTAIGQDGRIMEWSQPFKETEPGHRHISHLYALYPGYGFFALDSSHFYIKAAQNSLEYRLHHGGGHTGWSAAWVTNLWARLKNGNEALKAFNTILQSKSATNLFDLHPPFQIDGNLGATAGIAEMLIQSHHGYIELLPALPDKWPTGEVRGLCARGGFELDIKWKNHKLISVTIRSKTGGHCNVKYQNSIAKVDFSKRNVIKLDQTLNS